MIITGKNDKWIMAVKREILFGNDYFEGFRPANVVDYKSRILENFEWVKRSYAEKNPQYKQPIGYSIIVNPTSKRIFAYQRPMDEEYDEKRLRGRWSWGIGGHIEKLDIKSCENPIHASVVRELKEEIGIEARNPDLNLGYINNDTDEVGRVHFGLLYIVETTKVIEPKSPEIKNGELKTIEELEEICRSSESTVEEWSKISFDPLKLYLKRVDK